MAQTANMTAREVSRERRRQAYETGKTGLLKMAGSQDRTRSEEMASVTTLKPAASNRVAPKPRKVVAAPAPVANAPIAPASPGKRTQNPTRAASLARRQAMSTSGKRAVAASTGTRETTRADLIKSSKSGGTAAQTASQDNTPVNKIGSMEKKNRPTGRIRPGQRIQGAAQDANWKVGASGTSHGQTVTGTMVGQSGKVTGEEPGAAGEITGTDYDGADVPKTPRKVSVTSTASGNSISGTNFNRSAKVTGDEPGTCKSITGNQYVGAGQVNEFCGTSANGGTKTITGNNPARAGRVTGGHRVANRNSNAAKSVTSSANGARGWAKGKQSTTLLGGTVTGTRIGRGSSVTGDLRGACLSITGDEYVGQEQYNAFCETTPVKTERKVNVSTTMRNKLVTGTLQVRDSKVTGDEPGTCQAVTGTPYSGANSYADYCDADANAAAMDRVQRGRATPGMPMTGLQPGIGGKLTGAGKGACESLTGTPYVGTDQFADACGTDAGNVEGAWGQFTVDAPSHASRSAAEHSAMTGAEYEPGRITGSFGKANGKVTGTEEANFVNGVSSAAGYVPTTVDSRVKSRITGEGQDSGLKITGDDWDRNEHVTGTEGLSATRRNPTRRSTSGAMAMESGKQKRNESMAPPSSKVTGSSGNTDKGSLITYSGGARG
ncbi:MAG: CsoS2 family carboxysome shell protein [Acidiferrobacterales bacterium]|nr:CsoS2 family carboxysome shell protein [Acidiferrobacterales bacterium]